jgi:type I restriction enzyme, S subunit
MLITETNKTQQTSSHNGDAKLVSPTKNKVKEFSLLKPINFRIVSFWDTKRFFSEAIKSKYPIETLGKYISEQRNIVKPFQFPNETFKILGVNNKEGLFDAYDEKGSGIKQPYQKVDNGFLVYNPYRINVGSIGLKAETQLNEYISIAYIVFSCLDEIFPEFLYRLFQTDKFNQVVRDNTAGSVRQNLSFSLLEKLQIPLPPLATQEKLVTDYNAKMLQAKVNEAQAKVLEQKIEIYLLKELGIKIQQAEKKKGLQITSFKSLERWDFDYLDANKTDIFSSLEKAKFSLQNIGYAFNFVGRGWSKKSYVEKYFNYIEIGAIDSLVGITKSEKLEKSNAPSRATQTVRTNDLILGLTRPNLKRFAIVNSKYDNFVCSSGFQVIEQSGTYNLEFLLEFLKSEAGIKQFEVFMTGALYPAITAKQLKAMKIPIPPLKIQNKIAYHINTLKAEIKILKFEANDLRNKAKSEFESELFEM